MKTIQVNGDSTQTSAETIQQLLEELSLDQRLIAVEQNMEVVPRSTYSQAGIAEDDRIEIVHMIGGG